MNNHYNNNQESPDIANYLNIGGGKYYDKVPIGHLDYQLASRKCFPSQKNGVSGDSPAEFKTKHTPLNTALSQSVLHKDPAVRNEAKSARIGSQFDGYSIRAIQTSDISNTLIPIKQETRSPKPKELYK